MRDNGSAPADRPSFRAALGVWTRIGLLSFGGPAGQIALMHRVLIEERRWLTEAQYLSALNFCMLLPGPEAMQLATYAGWRLHGTLGGLAAGLLFVLPGAALILALGLLYAALGALGPVAALFTGIKAAVLAIVFEALIRVASRALRGPLEWGIAAAAFLALFLLSAPFPAVVGAALAAGFFAARGAPHDPLAAVPAPVPLRRTLATVAVWLAVWIVPLALVALVFGRTHVLAQLAWLYAKLAVVTFGGAYAALSYMAQQVVEGYGWLTAGEMLDALGLAETTPGPLILVTEFVAVLAAMRHGGGPPMAMGALGALVALWATFAPCFLWIFAGAPYIERLTHEPKLSGALRGVAAAVVGVILHLTVWFALHVLFAEVNTVELGWLSVAVPGAASFRPVQGALALFALLLVFGLRAGIATTLALSALAALAAAALG